MIIINSPKGIEMVKRKDVIKFFKAYGFELEHGTNHDRLKHPDGRWTTLGRHVEINDRKFDDMKKQAELKWSVYVSPRKKAEPDKKSESDGKE